MIEIVINESCICGGSVAAPNPGCERCGLVAEILRLRGEVATLRREAHDLRNRCQAAEGKLLIAEMVRRDAEVNDAGATELPRDKHPCPVCGAMVAVQGHAGHVARCREIAEMGG